MQQTNKQINKHTQTKKKLGTAELFEALPGQSLTHVTKQRKKERKKQTSKQTHTNKQTNTQTNTQTDKQSKPFHRANGEPEPPPNPSVCFVRLVVCFVRLVVCFVSLVVCLLGCLFVWLVVCGLSHVGLSTHASGQAAVAAVNLEHVLGKNDERKKLL